MLTFSPLTIDGFVEALLAESGFVLFLFVCSLVLPGRIHDGAPGPDGRREFTSSTGCCCLC